VERRCNQFRTEVQEKTEEEGERHPPRRAPPLYAQSARLRPMTGSPPPNDVHSILAWYGNMDVVVAHHLVGTDGPVGPLKSRCTSSSGNFPLPYVFSGEPSRSYKDNVACKGTVLGRMAVGTVHRSEVDRRLSHMNQSSLCSGRLPELDGGEKCQFGAKQVNL